MQVFHFLLLHLPELKSKKGFIYKGSFVKKKERLKAIAPRLVRGAIRTFGNFLPADR
jgi:hypothetical protein